MHSIADILTKLGLSADKLAQHKANQDNLQELFNAALNNPHASKYCKVANMLDNRLYIDITHPTWYAYMRYNTQEIKNKLSQNPKCKNLQEIVLRKM